MDYGQPERQQPDNNYQPQPQSLPPQAQTPSPIPPAPSTPPKKRFSSQALIITVLSILLLATAGALAYVLMSDRGESKNVATTEDSSEQKDTVEEVTKEEVPPVKDEYEGWKTFPQDAQSIFWRPTDLSTAFSFTDQIKTEFRFPDGWKQVPIAGDTTCRLVMGRVTEDPFASAAGPVDTNGGTMCIGAENYTQGQTVDTKTSTLLASGDWVREEETTVGGIRAITVARIKNIPPDAGGKIFYTYVDNLRPNNSMKVGTIVGCAPSGDAAEREAFLKDCNKAIDSIKFL